MTTNYEIITQTPVALATHLYLNERRCSHCAYLKKCYERKKQGDIHECVDGILQWLQLESE